MFSAVVPGLVWCLHSDKGGDNGQVDTILAALDWQVERKFLAMREQYVWGKPRFRATLDHIDLNASDPLEPPWPDLILTVGRRPSMAALWVRDQSGGQTRVVLIGKPSGRMTSFELVVASAENQLPPLANYLPIGLPLMRVDLPAVKQAADTWRGRLSDLPRPLIAILIGGETNPFRMNIKVAERLNDDARRVIAMGGTPYLSTSRRTPPDVVSRLQQILPAEARFFAWRADSADNPYKALLGLADGFIVTGDSISMMVEVLRLGKPLQIFSLPYDRLGALDQYRRAFAHWLFHPRLQSRADRIRHAIGRQVYYLDVFKLLSSTRDFHAFHRMLVEKGLADWCGGEFRAPQGELPDDVERVVHRMRQIAET